VAKVDSDRVGGAQVDPVLGGVVVERQQHVEAVGDLGDCGSPGMGGTDGDGELDKELRGATFGAMTPEPMLLPSLNPSPMTRLGTGNGRDGPG
jgi:hypothetical protein